MGFLAAFNDVLVGLRGEMRSISGLLTGTGMEGIMELDLSGLVVPPLLPATPVAREVPV